MNAFSNLTDAVASCLTEMEILSEQIINLKLENARMKELLAHRKQCDHCTLCECKLSGVIPDSEE